MQWIEGASRVKVHKTILSKNQKMVLCAYQAIGLPYVFLKTTIPF